MLKYTEPRMSIIELETHSIIVTSSGLANGGDANEDTGSVDSGDLGFH